MHTSTEIMGRVAISYHNMTGYLCQYGDYTNEDASILCHLLNFTNGGVHLLNPINLPQPTSYRHAWGGYVRCKGGGDSQTLGTMDCFPYMAEESVYYRNSGYSDDGHSGAELSDCGKYIASISCHAQYGKVCLSISMLFQL